MSLAPRSPSPHCAPRSWSAAYPLVTAWLAAAYADGVTAARHYGGVVALVEHHIAEAARGWGGLTQRYGDWCAVPRGFGDGCVHVTNASGYLYFVLSLDAAAQLANAVGKPGDAARYAGLAAEYRAAFQAHEFNAADCTYGTGTPFEAAAAWTLGVVTAANATACVAAAMRAYYSGGSPFPGHMNGGILSARHVFPALSDGGGHGLAVGMALQTSFPSYGWWLANGATTLAERWQNTLPAPLADSSLNHIMYGGVSPWLHSRVAGLQRAPTTVSAVPSSSWRQLLVAPGPDARVGYAASSLLTIDGAVGAGWALPAAALSGSGSGAVCGVGADNTQLTLACVGADGATPPGGVFTGVEFASYGQPAGGCFGPLRASAACASNVSAAVVAAACVGKATCTIDVSAATFGGVDPCPGHPKRLAVQLAGTGCALPTLTVTATVPVNGAATVVLPLNDTFGGGAPSAALVYEGSRLVWAGGRSGGYVPGTPGVARAAAGTTADGGPAVLVTVGSGSYAFVVAQVPAPAEPPPAAAAAAHETPQEAPR